MRIKKVSKTTATSAQIVNSYSSSEVSGYSCSYINELNTYSTEEQRIGTWINRKTIVS